MNIITNITIGNWYLVRGKPTKITPANVIWAFRDGCCRSVNYFPLASSGIIGLIGTAASAVW